MVDQSDYVPRYMLNEEMASVADLESQLLETQRALSKREAELKMYKKGTIKGMYQTAEIDKMYQAAIASGEGWREVAYDLGGDLEEALKRESDLKETLMHANYTLDAVLEERDDANAKVEELEKRIKFYEELTQS